MFPASWHPLTRLCLRLMLWLAVFALLLWFAGAWLAARTIACPGSLALDEHHHLILDRPAQHGISITALDLSDGTPVLVCRPLAGSGLDERGRKLRTQLLERGLSLPEAGTENGATLVLLHGRHGKKEDSLPIAVRFCAAGFRCILPDLPGHGQHPVRVARYGLSESGLPELALREASKHLGFTSDQAGLWGMSMGGSVAVHSQASAPGNFQALVVVASFDELSSVIHRQCSHIFGATFGGLFHRSIDPFYAWLTGHRLHEINPAARASAINIPTLIVHGDDDPLIPLEAARRLHDSFSSLDKKWVNVGSGTHGNVLITPHPLYADMSEWFLKHLLP